MELQKTGNYKNRNWHTKMHKKMGTWLGYMGDWLWITMKRVSLESCAKASHGAYVRSLAAPWPVELLKLHHHRWIVWIWN